MSGQETRVYVLEAAAGRALSDALTRENYAFRNTPHARFQAQGDGVTATMYASGKLVVQGRGLDMWTDRFLPGASATPPKKRSDGALPEWDKAALGSDEAGKGDTFGALVVSAVAWPDGGDEEVLGWGLTDSKQMSDQAVRLLAPQLRQRFAHAERVLDPAEYNPAHTKDRRNVNHLLARLHSEVLGDLAATTGCRTAIVDCFSKALPVTAHFKQADAGLQVVEVPRAERHPAVAAASVLAREQFLESLRLLEEEWAVDLPKGSGAPLPSALRRFLDIHGPGKLGQVAKLHFKNVARAVEEHGG